MTRLEKCKLAVEKGYTYDPLSGNVTGPSGKVITRKSRNYIRISINHNKKRYEIKAHQFGWYIMYGEVIDCIDHIERVTKTLCNNSITNLRKTTIQENGFNTKAKGITPNINKKRWVAKITINQKSKHIGVYDTEEEAHQAYLDAKKIYHIIP